MFPLGVLKRKRQPLVFVNLSPEVGITSESGRRFGKITSVDGDAYARIASAKTTGKHYIEFEIVTKAYNMVIGVQNAGNTNKLGFTSGGGNSNDRFGYSAGAYSNLHDKTNNGEFTNFGINWCVAGRCVGVAYDADAGTVAFYTRVSKTDVLVSQGTAFTGVPSGKEPFVFFDSYLSNQGDFRIITPANLPSGYVEWS